MGCLLLAYALLAASCGGGGGADVDPGTATAQASSNRSVAAEVPSAAPVASNPTAAATVKEAVGSPSPVPVAPGTGYFVDAVGGSDSNPGSFQLPWRSLSKLDTVQLRAGDGIYLRCGSVWHDALSLSSKQMVAGAAIAGYGDCATAKATISGADDLSGGWSKSANVWSRSVPKSMPKISRMFIDGMTLRTAQWPNFGGIGHEYALSDAASPVSTTALRVTLSDLQALQGKDLTGATVQVRTAPYRVVPRTIASYDSGTGAMMFTTADSANPVFGGSGYVVQDKRWMLDAGGEFFHDTAAGMVYLIAPDSASRLDLNASTVEGSTRDSAAIVRGVKGVSLQNVAFIKARLDGLVLADAPAAVVTNIEASNNGRAGLLATLDAAPAAPLRGASISASSFGNNGVYGIQTSMAANVDIDGNVITDTGTTAAADGADAGIWSGPGNRVRGNTITRSGYLAIRFSGTGGTEVSNNDIREYCLRLSDCAAIYTWNGPTPNTAALNQLSLIEGNRIGAASPNLDGAVGGSSDIVVGIYLDDFSLNATVRNNVLVGMPMGIYVHNGSNHTITSNKIWLTTRTALWATMDQADADRMTGNVFSNNELAPMGSAAGTYPDLPQFKPSHAVWLQNNLVGYATLGAGRNMFYGNQLIQLQGNGGEVAWLRTASDYQFLTARGWRTLNPNEPAASAPLVFDTYRTTLGPELVPGGDFDNGLGSWGARLQTAAPGASIAATTGKAGCNGGCVLYTASNPMDMLNSTSFSVDAGVPYVLGMTAAYDGTARVRPWVGRWSSPWDSLATDDKYVSASSATGSAGDVIGQQFFFRPKTSTLARANVQLDTVGVPVGVDSVSVRALLGYTVAVNADSVAAVVATAGSARSINCADLGWPTTCTAADASGTAVPLPFKIPAGSSALLLRTNSPWKR